jgi:hypothetical protein
MTLATRGHRTRATTAAGNRCTRSAAVRRPALQQAHQAGVLRLVGTFTSRTAGMRGFTVSANGEPMHLGGARQWPWPVPLAAQRVAAADGRVLSTERTIASRSSALMASIRPMDRFSNRRAFYRPRRVRTSPNWSEQGPTLHASMASAAAAHQRARQPRWRRGPLGNPTGRARPPHGPHGICTTRGIYIGEVPTAESWALRLRRTCAFQFIFERHRQQEE